VTDKPIAVGFGISLPEHAAQVWTISNSHVASAMLEDDLLAQLQYVVPNYGLFLTRIFAVPLSLAALCIFLTVEALSNSDLQS